MIETNHQCAPFEVGRATPHQCALFLQQ
jgi:hypothetical protein